MTDGLRERKKRETRLALSSATIRLCVERGWDNVTVEDIAAAANVSVRTFRNYFSNKAEAVAARHLDRMRAIADELRARPSGEPLWESIAIAARAQFGLGAEADDEAPGADRWRDGLRLMLAEPALQGELAKANAAAQDELVQAIAERTGTDPVHDVYPELVAAVVGAGSAVAITRWLRTGSAGSIEVALREVFERIAAGLPAP
ncbi:TetR family transcriptional regulator [Rhizohabitans arisaemae]|uniref:acyl-CoA-like ligand-binding transcription factor n=1 Tax=Rhizohabitans arisaemae TaxID=2720610 RepID=UPI0024B17C9B|nr:TetR family transcriptional regulator [Rhizohabitans arisaemae]